jgi:hypothetical protein
MLSSKAAKKDGMEDKRTNLTAKMREKHAALKSQAVASTARSLKAAPGLSKVNVDKGSNPKLVQAVTSATKAPATVTATLQQKPQTPKVTLEKSASKKPPSSHVKSHTPSEIRKQQLALKLKSQACNGKEMEEVLSPMNTYEISDREDSDSDDSDSDTQESKNKKVRFVLHAHFLTPTY